MFDRKRGAITEHTSPQTKGRADFCLEPFGRLRRDDTLIVYFRDIQADIQLGPSDLCLIVEGGDVDKKPNMKFRQIRTSDTKVQEHPWWWPIIFCGTTFPRTCCNQSTGQLDPQLNRRFFQIRTVKVKIDGAIADMKEHLGEKVVVPLMVLSAYLYRKWLLRVLQRQGKAHELIPDNFRGITLDHQTPTEKWINSSMDYYDLLTKPDTPQDEFDKETDNLQYQAEHKRQYLLILDREGCTPAQQYYEYLQSWLDPDRPPAPPRTRGRPPYTNESLVRDFSRFPAVRIVKKEHSRIKHLTQVQNAFAAPGSNAIPMLQVNRGTFAIEGARLIWNPKQFFGDERRKRLFFAQSQ